MLVVPSAATDRLPPTMIPPRVEEVAGESVVSRVGTEIVPFETVIPSPTMTAPA